MLLCWLPQQQWCVCVEGGGGCSARHGRCSQFQVVYLESARKRTGIQQVSISHQLAWCLSHGGKCSPLRGSACCLGLGEATPELLSHLL